MKEESLLTDDHLLGGRVRYTQPRSGQRASLDPVLLAAAVPARAGDAVLDAGTGAGAALLCLAARVPGVFGAGLDHDPALLRLARANAAGNGWPDLSFVLADLARCPIGGPIDHAFANPPYHEAGGTPSPSLEREDARRGALGLISIWAAALARPLRHRGTVTFILPPGLLEAAIVGLRAAHAPVERVLPIWPKAGHAARFLLVRGRKHGKSPLIFRPGLILHDGAGAFLPEAEAVLRHGAALDLDAV